MILRLILFVSLLFFSSALKAQDPKRFQNEIDAIDTRYRNKIGSQNLIIFTGSSSIRRWQNISDNFPGKNIINTGFGGSHMSDLLYYSDSLIIKYQPVQVFIYEGDNDISNRKKTEDIIKDAKILFSKINSKLPKAQIVILSVKPSVSRWDLKDEYLKLNKSYEMLSIENKYIAFIDVWTPLLNKEGLPKKEIFVSDSLHINNLGYDIWVKEIKKIIYQ